MTLIERVRRKHVGLMQKTLQTLDNVLRTETTERLQKLTDGEDGWSVTEVMGHLLDADRVFYERAVHILNEAMPMLQPFEHEAMVQAAGYRQQDPLKLYQDLVQSRQGFMEFFKALTPEQWERAGIHPEYGEWTLTDSVMQVGHHDANHIEQITRILTQEG